MQEPESNTPIDPAYAQLLENQAAASAEKWRKINTIGRLTNERQNFKDNSRKEKIYAGYLKLMNFCSR